MGDSLYSDLVESPEAGEIKRLQEALARERVITKRLTEQLETTNKTLVAAQEDLTILKRNISAIYHTAKKEIERKDVRINDLRKASHATSSSSAAS